MNEEEKKAIEILKSDKSDFYYRFIDVKNSVEILLNLVDKQLEEIDTYKETENDYEHELARKDEEIEELEVCLQAEEKYAEGLNNDIKSLLNIEPNNNFISKDKIKNKIKEYKKQIEKDKKEIKESILRSVVISDKEERIEILLELLEE